MDSLTQAVLGGAVGEVVLGKKVGNHAVLWGAIAGTIPDLDVLLAPILNDDVTANEIHRGFSHSIIFAFIVAPLLGWVLSKIYSKKTISWRDWTLLMFWGLVTHPLLDMHTSWGTQLLWPLPYKFSYKNIFVVDPIYTLPFLGLLIVVMFQRQPKYRKKFNQLGLVISTSYLLLTVAFKGVAHYQFTQSLERQGISYLRLSSRPSPLNTILWTANAETESQYLVGHYSLLDQGNHITWKAFHKKHDLLQAMQGEGKVKRIAKLCQNWYTFERIADTMYINDLRFGQIYLEDPLGRENKFVFQYKLFYNANKELVVKQAINHGEERIMLQELWHRIKGI